MGSAGTGPGPTSLPHFFVNKQMEQNQRQNSNDFSEQNQRKKGYLIVGAILIALCSFFFYRFGKMISLSKAIEEHANGKEDDNVCSNGKLR